MSRATIAAGSIVALGFWLAHSAVLAQTPPAPPKSAWGSDVPVQVDTGNAARRGLRGAQAPTPPAAAAPPAPVAKPEPKDFVRGPEQEYQDCIKLWDKGTHMTPADWARTCRRIQNRLQTLTKETQLSPGRQRVR